MQKSIKKRKIESKKTLLTIDDFTNRWLHGIDYQHEIYVNATIDERLIEENEEIDFSFVALLGAFETIFSIADKSIAVQNILTNALQSFNNLKVDSQSSYDLKTPSSLKIAGARMTPSQNNVDQNKPNNNKRLKSSTVSNVAKKSKNKVTSLEFRNLDLDSD